MPKKESRKHRRSKKTQAKRGPEAKSAAQRLSSLDSLRGFAILLMIVDHVAWLFFDQPIEPASIRICTRLSMPLFCVLMGYLSADHAGVLLSKNAAREFRWQRVVQLVAAAGIVNFVYFTLYQQVEILVSLVVCACLIGLVGNWFGGAIVACLLFGFDPSVVRFDFAISVVASCVAGGMLLKRLGFAISSIMAVVLASVLIVPSFMNTSFTFVPPPSVYVFGFLPAAIGLVHVGSRNPTWSWLPLEWIGRYPLTVYVMQYLLLLGLSSSWQ